MWYCPYWEIALKQFPAIKKQFEQDNIDIQIHYIANWEWTTADAFNSLHWVTEAEEDIRQLCVQKYYWTDKLIDYMQKRYENADNYWKVTDEPSVAIKSIGWNADTINTCVTWWEWGQLLTDDIKIANWLWIWASPTWYANEKYQFGWIDATAIITNFCKYNPELKWCQTEVQSTWTADASNVQCWN
jgi:hypothetical protein